MKRYLHITLITLVSVIVLTLTCCERHTEAWQKMDLAENLMETQPDSSLVILNGINAENLGGKEESARYALLKSMALDKNYIDTTDFRVLQPAIDYYLKKGTPDEKLRTYYYQGCIYLNNGDEDKAMESFVRCIDLKNKVTDSLTLARSLCSQSIIQEKLYDFEAVIANRLEAAKLFDSKKINSRYNCLLSALNASAFTLDKKLADSLIYECRLINENFILDDSSIFPYELLYAIKFGDKEDIRDLLNHRPIEQIEDPNYLMYLANGYQTIGQNDSAFIYLKKVTSLKEPYDSLKYSGLMSIITESSGDYKSALDNYRVFNEQLSNKHTKLFDRKVQSSEERHKMELQAQKDAESINSLIKWCIFVLIVVSFIIVTLCLINRNKGIKERQLTLSNEKLCVENKNLLLESKNTALEAESLRHRIESLEDEREGLMDKLASQNNMPEEVRNEVKKRIKLLNTLLASEITSNKKLGENIDDWVEDLVANAEKLMTCNYHALQGSHPEFINYLRERDLTDDEIKYVCLYVMGLRSKEVGHFINKPSHVNLGTTIRKKLGLEGHSTILSVYIRKLFDEL